MAVFHFFLLLLKLDVAISVKLIHATQPTSFIPNIVLPRIASYFEYRYANCTTMVVMEPTDKVRDFLCESNVTLIIDTTSYDLPAKMVQSFSSSMDVPTISTSFKANNIANRYWNVNEKNRNYLVTVVQPADSITDIVKVLAKVQNYTCVAMMYDTSYFMSHKLPTYFLNSGIRHTIVSIQPGRIKEQLKKLNALDLLNFFIIGGVQVIEIILSYACQLNYFSSSYSWHVITHEYNQKLTFKCGDGKVIYVHPVPNKARIEGLSKFLEPDYKVDLFAEFYTDMLLMTVFGDKNRSSPINQSCDAENTSRNVATNLRAFILDEKRVINGKFNNHIFHSYKEVVANIVMNFTMTVTGVGTKSVPLGTWNSLSGQRFRRKMMEQYKANVIYKIALAIQEPFVFPDEGVARNFSGYCIDLIEMLAIRLKFSYELYVPENFVPHGKGHDMVIEEVYSGKAMMGLGSLSVTHERKKYVSFTIPIYENVGLTFMTKTVPESNSLFKLLVVLDYYVWLYVFLAYCFASFVLWISSRFSPYSKPIYTHALTNSTEGWKPTLKECIWFCLGCLTTHGGGMPPRCPSGRIVAGAWWLFCFLIIASYTANLASFLSVTQKPLPLNNLRDLVNQYKVDYFLIYNSSVWTYIENMAYMDYYLFHGWKWMHLYDNMDEYDEKLVTYEYPLENHFTKILRYLYNSDPLESFEEAIETVRNSTPDAQVVYVGDAVDINFAVLTSCDLETVGQEFMRKQIAIALSKGAEFQVGLNEALMEFLNNGQLAELKAKWWRNNPKAVECPARRKSSGLSVKNVVGFLVLIGAGLATAMLLKIFTHLWGMQKKYKNTKIEPVNQDLSRRGRQINFRL